MDKTKLGMIGAISSLAALPAAAGAAVTQEAAVPPAQSFSDLFQPIPNATEKLKVSDAQEAANGQDARLIEVQWHHHHHHHHHNHYYRRYYNGYWAYPRYYYRRYYRNYYHHHHHHHHHHHNHYYQ